MIYCADYLKLNMEDAGKRQEPITNVDKFNDMLKIFTNRQDAEAKLHWSRNSYFLVVMSILILAYSQKPVENMYALRWFRIIISLLGSILSIMWWFIQYRSSQYMFYYKNQARKFAKLVNAPDVYPEELGGVEMRKLAYVLPTAFWVIWVAFLILSIL